MIPWDQCLRCACHWGRTSTRLYLDPPVARASGLSHLARPVDAAPLSGHPVTARTAPPTAAGLRRLAGEHCGGVREPHRHLLPRPEPPANDFALDNAWTALYDRLRAAAMLPESGGCPRSKRAQSSCALLFSRCAGLSASALRGRVDRAIAACALSELNGCSPTSMPSPDPSFWPRFGARTESTVEPSVAAPRRLPAVIAERPASPTAKRDPTRPRQDKGQDKGAKTGTKTKTREIAEDPALRDLRLHLARCISAYAVKVLA